LRGPTLAADFKQMVMDYIEQRFGSGARGATERLEAVEA
jgi:(E)-4-hydroxy-3-methylbut-2-enyl-diphosphate synthase